MGRHGDRRSVGRIKNILGAKHEKLRLHDGCVSKRKMDGHLVTIKVGVECRTSEWVQLNGLTFYHSWLECLDAKPVQGRRTVQ